MARNEFWLVPPEADGDIFAPRLAALARAAIRRARRSAPWADRGDAYSAALATAALAVAAEIAAQKPATAAARIVGEPRAAVCAALEISGIDSALAAAAGELANALADSGDNEEKQAEHAASRSREWRGKFARGEWKTPEPEKWPPLRILQDDPTAVIRDYGGGADDGESPPWIDAGECRGGAR